MKVLLDHNVNRRFRRHLVGHDVRTAREMRWEALANGALLRSAAAAAFDVFLSIDKNLEHQQNLKSLPLPVVVLDSASSALSSLEAFAPALLQLLGAPLDRLLHVIDADGRVLRLDAPRGRSDPS